MAISKVLAKALANPSLIPAAVLRRLFPSHPTLGYRWLRLSDGTITFRESGFVAADSAAMLLARHNYECATIREALNGLYATRSLEVGCGYGRLTPIFAAFSSEHVAIDINEDALNRARLTYPDFIFQFGSATDLPFPTANFELATTWTVLQHVPPDRIESACHELVRVLDPHRGLLLICEESRYPDQIDPRAHTWHRRVNEYEALLQPLALRHTSTIEQIDRLPGMESPGTVMVFGPKGP